MPLKYRQEVRQHPVDHCDIMSACHRNVIFGVQCSAVHSFLCVLYSVLLLYWVFSSCEFKKYNYLQEMYPDFPTKQTNPRRRWWLAPVIIVFDLSSSDDTDTEFSLVKLWVQEIYCSCVVAVLWALYCSVCLPKTDTTKVVIFESE